jgi:hypothetical protein
MANDFREKDVFGQVIFLAIDNRELDFKGSETIGQMLLGELKLGHNKLWQVIISPINAMGLPQPHKNFY